MALSLNSQREGAAGGSWRLCFNQMSKLEPGALLRGGPSSLPQASFAWEATGLPPGTRWMRQLRGRFLEDSQGLGRGRPQSETTGRGWTGHSLMPTFQSTQVQNTLSFFVSRTFSQKWEQLSHTIAYRTKSELWQLREAVIFRARDPGEQNLSGLWRRERGEQD